MSIKSKAKAETKTEYEIKVIRAKDFTKNGEPTSISFDLVVNGVKIYNCWYRTYEDRKNPGEETGFIGFPSRKGSDGKYYNYAYFDYQPYIEEIERQIVALLDK